MAIPDKHKEKYIFHFTDLRNLDSIIKKGLLCTNEKNRLGIEHYNIANQAIQERRADTDVTAGPGGKIHDYVPFYFSSRNPMLLSLLNKKNCDQNLIIYLCVKIDRLDKDDAVFTNSSANTIVPPSFYDDPSHLDDLEWNLISSSKWGGWSNEDKHKKMAEAFIHTKVGISEINAIVVYNEFAKRKVKKLFDQNGIPPPEILFHNQMMPKYDFYYTKLFFKDRKDYSKREYETLVIGPCSLLHKYKKLIKGVKIVRQEKRKSYPYKTVKELVKSLNQNITILPEMKDTADIFQNYAPHNDTVGDHTKKVVEEIQKTEYYQNTSKEVKSVLLLGAYLHDIGKGPANKWENGQMSRAYLDHPADAIPMLKRILTEDIEELSNDEIRRLCMLVVYHDLIGECCEKGRDMQQIADLIEDGDDYDMLTAISIADTTAIMSCWGENIINDAKTMKDKVMKLMNR